MSGKWPAPAARWRGSTGWNRCTAAAQTVGVKDSMGSTTGAQRSMPTDGSTTYTCPSRLGDGSWDSAGGRTPPSRRLPNHTQDFWPFVEFCIWSGTAFPRAIHRRQAVPRPRPLLRRRGTGRARPEARSPCRRHYQAREEASVDPTRGRSNRTRSSVVRRVTCARRRASKARSNSAAAPPSTGYCSSRPCAIRRTRRLGTVGVSVAREAFHSWPGRSRRCAEIATNPSTITRLSPAR